MFHVKRFLKKPQLKQVILDKFFLLEGAKMPFIIIHSFTWNNYLYFRRFKNKYE